jgi:hypothetical protein
MIARTLRGLAAATLLVVTVSAASQAQMMEQHRFGVSAGVALPMGDFGDAAGLGLQIGGQLALPMGERVSLRFNVDYGRYSGEGGIDHVSLLGGVANVVLPLNSASALKPYVLGGLGFYQTTVDVGGGSVDNSDLAFNIGIGYDFTMGSRSMFTELKYLSIQGDGGSTNTLPIVIGLRF